MSTKRILSLVLALVMVLGTFGTVFAAPTANEKAEFLKSKGVLVGNNAGDLMLEQALIRSHAAVLLSRLYGNKDADVVDTEMPFTDVTDVTKPFVAWAYNEGLVAGNSATTFNPGGPLTAQQFASLLLRALGHEATVEAYESAFEDAKELGIFAGVTVGEKDQLNRAEMAEMTYNALEVKLADDSQTLAEKLGIVMPGTDEYKDATELKIKDVYTENLAEIVVELSNTTMVKTDDQLLNAKNYRLSGAAAENVTVHHVHQEGNKLILTLVPYGFVTNTNAATVLRKGAKFGLTVRNVNPALNITKSGIVAVDNTIPVVENVEFMGTYGIKVTTSEPIANPLERNFRLDGRTAMIVEQYGRDIILTPYHNVSFDKDATELTVDILEDFAGYKTIKETHEMELSADEGLPNVVEAYRSGSKLVVEFDRDVFHKSVSGRVNRLNLGNVSFVERGVPFYAEEEAEKVDTNVVEYTFNREIPRGIEVTVEGVANHFNKAMVKESILPVEYRDEFAPVVIGHDANVVITEAEQTAYNGLTKAEKDVAWLDGLTPVATDAMTIEFDKDIYEFKNLTVAELNARKAEFFELYRLDITNRGKSDAAGVNLTVVKKGSDWVEVAFTGITLNNKNRDFDYILEVKNFSDMNRIRMNRDYLDFQVVQRGKPFAISSPIVVKSNTYFNRQGTEIILTFNRAVNKEEASNAKNYYLNSKLLVSEAVVERDGRTVALIVYDKTPAQVKAYGVLEVSPRVVDLSASPQSVAERFWDLNTGLAIADKNVAADSGIAYVSDRVDGKVFVTAPATAADVALTITPKAGDNFEVVKVVGAGRLPLTTFALGTDLGFTGIDTNNQEVKVEIYNNGKLVETTIFFTKDMRTANLSSPIAVTGTDAAVAVPAVAATGTITFASLSDAQTVIIDTTTLTYKTDGSGDFKDIAELTAAINALATVDAADDGNTVTITATTAGVAGNSIVLTIAGTAGTLTGGANALPAVDRVAPKLTLTFTGADLKEGTFTVSMVIGGVNYAGLTAKVTNATTVEVTGFPESVTVGTTLKTPNTVSSIVGLETVNGEAAIVSSPVTLP